MAAARRVWRSLSAPAGSPQVRCVAAARHRGTVQPSASAARHGESVESIIRGLRAGTSSAPPGSPGGQ
eukprot:302477-Hanusia_phi.AAC.1